MPGFGSFDQIISSTTESGREFNVLWNKNMLPTTAATAGQWSFLPRGAGNPGSDTLYNTGTNLTFQPTSFSTSGASGIPTGGDVSPFYKYITQANAFSAAATTMPAVMVLVDLVGFYRVTSVTTTSAQSLTNTLSAFSTFTADAGTDVCTHTNINLLPFTRVRLTTSGTLPGGLATATDYFVIRVSDTTCQLASSYANAVAGTAINITDAGTGTHTINTLLPRYTNGAGLQALMWNTNSSALGAATPNLSIGYTNSEQTASRATPTVLPVGNSAAANGTIIYSGTGAGKYGPFMPRQGADSGIAQIDTTTISVSYVSGEFSIGLVRPLIVMPMTTVGVASERYLVGRGARRIYDGANLQWLIYHGAATPVNSSFFGTLEFAWN